MTETSQATPTAACPFHFDLRDPHTRATAYAIYDRLRAEAPVSPAILTQSDRDRETDFSGTLGREVFFATDYDSALETLTDERFALNFVTIMTPQQRAQLPPVPDEFRPLLRNLLSLDPPDHTRLRRLVQPSWTPRVLEALRPRIQAIADELIDAAEQAAAARGEKAPNRSLELVDAFAYPLPMTVICELLGVPKEDRPRVRTWSEALINGQGITEEMRADLAAFSDYLRALFAEKQQHPTEDMTSWLVQAEEEGDKLDEEELLSMVFILVVAGHVTTVNLIGSAVLALLDHPDQLAKLEANPALVPNAVEEVLRYWGPVEMASPRFARETLSLDGATIEQARAVFPVLAAANRDPARFPAPDRFDIERPDASRHVAFGKGVHLCLGAPLARIEGQVAVETIFRRMPQLRLAEPLAEPPLHQSLFRGPVRLPLLF
jgi:cytochrome P450 PksS